MGPLSAYASVLNAAGERGKRASSDGSRRVSERNAAGNGKGVLERMKRTGLWTRSVGLLLIGALLADALAGCGATPGAMPNLLRSGAA